MKHLLFHSLFLVFGIQLHGQIVRADNNFYVGTGFNGAVWTTTIQQDGKVLVGGEFTSYNGVSTSKIARLNTDGSIDQSFTIGTGFNQTVYSIIVQSDGKIIVGGDFDNYNGNYKNNVVKLNSNGTLDSNFDFGMGLYGHYFWDLALQNDGKIVVVGQFNDFNGYGAGKIGRLNSNGTVDTTFAYDPNQFLFGANGDIRTVKIQNDGKIIIGGMFNTYNGVSRNKIARLNSNGTLDTSFDPINGFDGTVLSCSIQPDGKILVGGNFSSYNSISRNRIARLNSNGTIDALFDPGLGFDGPVFTTNIQPDGKILVGGEFISYNASNRKGIARLNSNGIIDNSFYSGLELGITNACGVGNSTDRVQSIGFLSNNSLYIGGAFAYFGSASRNNFSLLTTIACPTTIYQFLNQTACHQYQSATGRYYFQSGTYVETLQNISGCDSIVRTLNLTINSNSVPYTLTQVQMPVSCSTPNGSIFLEVAQTFDGALPFISEFFNGIGSNKWVEIYNPTDSVIDLGGPNYWNFSGQYSGQNYAYKLSSSSGSYSFPINTLIQPHSTLTISNQPGEGDFVSCIIDGSPCYLEVWTNYSPSPVIPPSYYSDIIDIVNPIVNKTLIRKDYIHSGDTTLNSLPFVISDWSILPLNSTSFKTHYGSDTLFSTNFHVLWEDASINNPRINLSPGYYMYSVIDNSNGCIVSQDTISLTQQIENIVISISSNPAFGNAPLNVAFANQTPNLSNYNFTWYFGDGTSQQSNAPFLSHIYTQNGYADITVMADNLTTGCSSSQTFNDMIFVIGGVTCTHTSTINQTGPLTGCVGDSILLSSNTDPSFTYQWNKNGIPVSGATSSSFYPTQSGSYTVTIYQNNCPVTSAGISVTMNALPSVPNITSSGTIVPCSGGSMTLTAPSGMNSYLWNTGATTSSINVSQSGNYFVTVSNSAGCQNTSNPFAVNASFMQPQQVCIVGVDSLTNENKIIWEKPLSSGIDSFYVYKETNVSNVYAKIGGTDYTDLAIFLDVNSNPTVQAYRYKVSIVDTCGVETNLGDFHKTIHLTINQGIGGAWNLIWSHYEGLNFGSYNIYRGTDPTNISLLTTIQSNLNSYTDLTPPTGPLYYQIEVVNPLNCDPTKSMNYGVSRSNIVNNGLSGVQEIVNTNIVVYPNPTNGNITLEVSSELVGNMYSILDFSGRIILHGKISSTQEHIVLQHVARGAYYLSIDKSSSVTKLIKQ